MHKILHTIRNISISSFFILVLTIISITLTSYTTKGKPYYIQGKIDKIQIEMSSIVNDIDSYTIDTRNNTTYITIYSSLTKEESLAILTRLYMYLDTNTYPIQIIFHHNDKTFWASINKNGISIS